MSEIMKNIHIIKIGSKCLFDESKNINYGLLNKKAKEIENLQYPCFIVGSGAIALGKMHEKDRRDNSEISNIELQGYASVGQKRLMILYSGIFDKTVSQLLVTEEDLKHENHIRDLLYHNMQMKRITVVNYNDGVDFKQLRKDNDTLAAQLLCYTHAKRLIILGNGYDGFKDHDDKIIPMITEIHDTHYKLCNGKSKEGNGGFNTKLDAAKMVLSFGSEMIISNINYLLEDIISGNCKRTVFRSEK
jgi:glutamate 5-kinase